LGGIGREVKLLGKLTTTTTTTTTTTKMNQYCTAVEILSSLEMS
jgi:hypothetical protein